MERLTSWCDEIEEAFLSCEKCKKNGMTECWSQENCTQTVVDRLAEIEDILGNEYDLDRLRELVQADREGRCVVSPCKVGDRLYTIRTIQDGSFTLEVYDSGEIRQISVNTNGTFFLVDYGHSLSANNFGKTVFKTREAAESALKAMKEREKSETD